MTLESAIVADKFMLDIDGMDEFINKEVLSQEEDDVQEEPYQGLPDSPDMDDVFDQENAERLLTPMTSSLELRYVYMMNEE